MTQRIPSLSTDQISAFVELARQGSLRQAGAALHITEQGARNRLLSLERRLGVELYRKRQGNRQSTPLTQAGRSFLPHAVAFLERAGELTSLFAPGAVVKDLHVVASQYLVHYVLIDAARRFHARFPAIRVRLSVHSEQEIETALLGDPGVSMGVAAPYESSPEIVYQHLFSMSWTLIAPPGHRLGRRRPVRLRELVSEPLIMLEKGSTGRQHILDAFHERDLSPRIHMETTSTEIVVRMVEAGLGLAIVPLLPSGVVTRGHRVMTRPIADPIRPIHSGILLRTGDSLSSAARDFVSLLRTLHASGSPGRDVGKRPRRRSQMN